MIRGRFRQRKASTSQTRLGKGRLQVQAEWIVDRGRNPFGLQTVLQCLPVFHLNCVLRENRGVVRLDVGRPHHVLQLFAVGSPELRA